MFDGRFEGEFVFWLEQACCEFKESGQCGHVVPEDDPGVQEFFVAMICMNSNAWTHSIVEFELGIQVHDELVHYLFVSDHRWLYTSYSH